MTPEQRAHAEDVLMWSITAEGGIGDVGDGAGLTSFGQTERWLSDFQLSAPQTTAQALENYLIWLDAVGLSALCTAADALALIVIDWAINSGHRTPIVALQLALQVPADGILGPVTRGALGRCNRERLARQMLAAQVRFRGAIITANPEKYSRFAKGWLHRDAAKIERL